MTGYASKSLDDVRGIGANETTADELGGRAATAQYFAAVSRYIFDNPQLFAPTEEEAAARQPETPFQLMWSRIIGSRLMVGTFWVCFVLPLLVSTAYFVFVATDRYATDIRLTLRSQGAGRAGGAGIMELVSGTAGYYANPDTYLVADYLRSRDVVAAVSRQVDLAAIWGRPEVDRLSRLAAGADAEDLVEMWRKRVAVAVDALSNTIQIEVQAFRPKDADAIASVLAADAEKMINDLSTRVDADTLVYMEGEVARAEADLIKAREKVTAFRNAVETVSPDKNAAATMGSMVNLMQEKLSVERDIARRQSQLAPDSPIMINLRTRRDALEAQIAEVNRTAFGSGDGAAGPSPFSAQFLEWDELLTNQAIAERLYGLAVDLLEQARQSASRQRSYVTPYVRPGLAQEARYPRRMFAVVLSAGAAFVFWLACALFLNVIAEAREMDA
jgi:capsular polysaccharide transport system permease protein